MSKNKDWDLAGFITASEYRKLILAKLDDKPKIPKKISKESNLYLSHVSKTLRELSEKGLIKCLNPNSKKGRLYTITRKGKEVIQSL